MSKPTIILATSNGVGMGHLARASAIALELKDVANPIIVSMAGGLAEVPEFLGIRCEYIPGRDRGWMSPNDWDEYLRDRLQALIDETDAKAISFDGVVPYPGVLALKSSSNPIPLIWMRRGLWRKNLQRFAIGLRASFMDAIIEPGDFARQYDHGPTAQRGDVFMTSPVSLYKKSTALDREESRKALGLDLSAPAVLVQLGTGSDDMNTKMTAALNGLVGWKDLQVVLTKQPQDKNGISLVPSGLSVKVVRYFPLAKVMAAFDAAICATGYNAVHEVLPARIPTVFISNIRGTDDQEARAQWCNDFGYAIRAQQDDLADITMQVNKLQNANVRAELSRKCSELPDTVGAKEIAQFLLKMVEENHPAVRHGNILGVKVLQKAAMIYRRVRPYKNRVKAISMNPIWSSSTDAHELRTLISGDRRFEHVIEGSSQKYRNLREAIAVKAYGRLLS
jgi:UDP-N-acetylglucosamine:LPS N-acetylglucosamine transferase